MIEITKLKLEIASQVERLGYPGIADQIREDAVESVSKAILYPQRRVISTPESSRTRDSGV